MIRDQAHKMVDELVTLVESMLHHREREAKAKRTLNDLETRARAGDATDQVRTLYRQAADDHRIADLEYTLAAAKLKAHKLQMVLDMSMPNG